MKPKRFPLAQIVVCKGCCCGNTAKGFGHVPVEELKAEWKANQLNRTVQLTVSGCLGPCELRNVVLVMTPFGSEWFGAVSEDIYTGFLRWAKECHEKNILLDLPPELAQHGFERFASEVAFA